MEMFDIKKRTVIDSFEKFSKSYENVTLTPDFESWFKSDKSTLRPFMREIRRNPIFSHDAFDSTYKALDKSRRETGK